MNLFYRHFEWFSLVESLAFHKKWAASTHQDYNAKGVCPAALGTKDQQPAAYSPKTGLMYTPLNHVCMTYEPVKSKYTAGQPWVGATLTMFAGPDGVMGGFGAYDPKRW